jgi:glutathione S-transferase
MYVLYYYPANANLAPHMVLEELGVSYRLELVDRDQEAHKSQEYLQLNPAGLIPVLVDGDLVLSEAAAICLHLVDKHPEAGLAPKMGTRERSHFYRWLVFLTNTLQARIMTSLYSERLADDAVGAEAVKRHAQEQVKATLDIIENHLTSAGPWMLGATYSAADPYLFMLCCWTIDMPGPAWERPSLRRFCGAMIGRPAVRRAFEGENLKLPSRLEDFASRR